MLTLKSSYRRGSNPKNKPTSAAPDNVTSQLKNGVIMDRYLKEKDQYKEFLVGHEEEMPMESNVGSFEERRATPNFMEWNRLWRYIVNKKNDGQGSVSNSTTKPVSLTFTWL